MDSFGVELAKVTLMLAKKLALDDAHETIDPKQGELSFHDDALPLDNLDQNVIQADALFTKWPTVDAVVGNPPYQSKNKRQSELEAGYQGKLRKHFPEVDGRADYCAYWFHKAQDILQPGKRAGLVGTNTIRQNYSREASLDHIVNTGGTITEAVSTLVWPGDAVVHVSIVNWIKGDAPGPKRLFSQTGDKRGAEERVYTMEFIGPSLSLGENVTIALPITANKKALCFQGQTHGHKAFLIKAPEAKSKLWLDKSGKLSNVLHPYLIATDFIARKDPKPRRYVIDFQGLSLLEAEDFPDLFKLIQKNVLPSRQAAAKKESERNDRTLDENSDAHVNVHHANFLKQWWQLSYAREDMIEAISKLSRYIACGRVTRRPIFVFLSREIHPNDALQVFAYEDDYTFGVLQSDVHWQWFMARCSTLKADPRYTSNTVWDSFPWPQEPCVESVRAVADAAVALRTTRNELAKKHHRSLRELYRALELPGKSALKDAQAELDKAVRSAYGIGEQTDILKFLLSLNLEISSSEKSGKSVRSAGLPEYIFDRSSYITGDSLKD